MTQQNVRMVGAAALLAAFVVSACFARQKSGEAKPDVERMVQQIRAETIERTVRKLVSFGTRSTLSPQDDPNRGIGAAANWLAGELEAIARGSGGRLRVEKQTFTQPAGGRILRPTPITNVLAWLPAERPEARKRLIVVSGHYDSMPTSPTDGTTDAPGANDDASGVAAVLECARVMAPYRFDATVLFAAVAGEEQGLLGSTYLAEQLKQDGWSVEAMLTNDIIGNSLGMNGVRDRRTVRLFSEGVPSDETSAQATLRRSVGGESDAPSRQLARFIKEVGEKHVRGFRVLLIARRDRYGRGGDHIPFNERGMAAVRFTEVNEDYRHQHQNPREEKGVRYGDLPEFVDFPYTAQVARVNAAALAELALAPAPPVNAVLVNRLSPDTELRWDSNPDPNIASYEIVWRDTTSPTWTHSRNVGRVTSTVIKGLSKDNAFFAVRAVSRDGHRSLAAFPRPAR